MADDLSSVEFHPLTPERWGDFESLFGERGACGGCWCMWWRISTSEFKRGKGEPNRRAMKALVDSGVIPGILAYDGGRAVGWCAVAPREEYPRLANSRILKPLDEQPVWSVVCFFVDKHQRRRGLSVALLRAAVDFVRERGGSIVEGYPVDPKKDSMPDVFVYHGLASTFLAAGFSEAARRSPTRPIMRIAVT